MAAKQNIFGLIDPRREVVEPPWSGCSFFMKARWARVMSSAPAPG